MPRILLIFLLTLTTVAVHAQPVAQPVSSVVELSMLPLGTVALDDGWTMRSGDNPQWAQPDLGSNEFNSSGWSPVTIGQQYRLPAEWTWYRLTLKLPPTEEQLSLLVRAPTGTFETYIDGKRVPGESIGSWLRINHSGTQVVPLPERSRVVTVALRVHYPKSLAVAYVLHLSVFLGGYSSIVVAAADTDDRTIASISSELLNLFILLGGVGALALSCVQRGHREYLWLGLFLLLAVATTAPWQAVSAGLLPLWVNSLISDPLAWVMYAALIEFLFAFLGRKPSQGWRLVQTALLAVVPIAILAAEGVVSPEFYWTFESFAFLSLSLAMPVFLLMQYFGGKREAGWLILPTALVSATIAQADARIAADALHIHPPFSQFFENYIVFLGPIPFSYTDTGNFLFVLAIGVVMFFRFTQVSRNQMSAAAELEAARAVQQVIIPEEIPSVPGFRLAAAYKPFSEVGGDFFQVLATSGGGVLAVIGDVSGKGMPAAMTVSLLVGTFRTLAHYTESPQEILAALNLRMIRRNSGGFTTALVVRLDPDGTLTAANAGHLAPYLNGQELAFDNGLPLGLSAQSSCAESTLQLPPDAQLTLMTDGVVEARNRQGELFGFDRSQDISTRSAEYIARTAQIFGHEDDITVLTIRYTPSATPAPAPS